MTILYSKASDGENGSIEDNFCLYKVEWISLVPFYVIGGVLLSPSISFTSVDYPMDYLTKQATSKYSAGAR